VGWGSLILGLAMGAYLGDFFADAGAFRSIEPHFAGRCQEVAGVIGAEDIVFDPESAVAYLSSTDWRALNEGRDGAGGIYAYAPAGDGPPRRMETNIEGPLHPHGLSLLRRDGEVRLFVVNHPTRAESRVEIFTVEGDRLAHQRTVEGEALLSINDVAAVGPESFYATNDAGTRADDGLRAVESYLRMPWANVIYFDGRQARVVAEDFAYANGIALSEDGHVVYVSETTGQRLHAFARNLETGALGTRQSLRIPSGLDNLTVAADGALWMGSHPQLLAFVAHAGDPSKLSPSQIFRVPAEGTELGEPEEIYLGDGSELSGSSVAVPVGPSRFLVGSVFEPHFLDCRRR